LAPPPAPEEAGIDDSRLRYASQAAPQQLAAVKLHRVFSPHWGFVDCSPTLCGFTGLRAGTVGPSLIHSCTSELTRQGIWLPFSRGLTHFLIIRNMNIRKESYERISSLDPRACKPLLPALGLWWARSPLRGSELPPALTGPYPGWTRGSGTGAGQD
jgi:hypothetical protein